MGEGRSGSVSDGKGCWGQPEGEGESERGVAWDWGRLFRGSLGTGTGTGTGTAVTTTRRAQK
jgi:hypothetical protein